MEGECIKELEEEEVTDEREGTGRKGEGMEAEAGGAEGEIGGAEDETGAKLGRTGGKSRDGESQDGGASGRSSTVVPGRREEGRASRCSMNVTWKLLKIFPESGSQRR